MNAQTSTNISGVDLTERAMLVSLSISAWTARKHDRNATESVISRFDCSETAGRFNKLLVNLGSVQTYQRIMGAARTFHYANTLPWIHDGADIISVDHFQAYSEKMREFQSQFNAAAADFLEQYPQLIAQAERDLGGLFDARDYPSPRELASKFSFSVRFSQLPASRDFRVAIGTDEVNRIRKQLDEDIKTGLDSAMSEIRARLGRAVKHMSEKLTDAKGIFRDSLISNLSELCNILPKLNLTDSPEITALVDEVKRNLCGFQPDELREDPALRKTAARAAADILKKLDGAF